MSGKGPASQYKFLEGNQPISTLLYASEELIASQEGVGLYDGKEKTPGRQNGTIHLTSHRLLYVDQGRPKSNSLALSLAAVKMTEFYAGFLSSSAKITVYLKDSASGSRNDEDALDTSSSPQQEMAAPSPTSSWICPVCSFSNPSPPNDSPSARPKCALCGVPRDPLAYSASTSSAPTPKPASPAPAPVSLSLPSHSESIRRSPSMPTLRQPEPIHAEDSSLLSGPDDSDSIACPACTYLNHRSMRYCEICSSPLPSRPSVSRHHPSRSSGSTPAPIELPTTNVLRISFRRGGEKPFYSALKRALQEKIWEEDMLRGTVRDLGSPGGQPARSGIQGIFATLDLQARTADTALQGNLHDLEVLMSKAKEMVSLASSLNAKLSAQEDELQRRRALFPDLPANVAAGKTQPEEATFIRSSLAQLGLPTVAVTMDMVRDENAYHEELAKELAGILTGRGMKGKGKGLMGEGESIIGLDEVWGGWNRARGIALIPPSSLLLAAPYLPQYTSPSISLRTFRSGLRVLCTPSYTDVAFSSRLVSHLSALPAHSASTVDIAVSMRLSVGLTQEMVESAEGGGSVVRDEGAAGGEMGEGTRWWVNVLDGYEWDGDV